MHYLLCKIGLSTSSKWSGTNLYEISQRNFLDIEFSLHFKNPKDGDHQMGGWLIWANFQMLITFELVEVREHRQKTFVPL